MQILFKGEVSDGYTVQLSGEFDACGCKEIRESLESIVSECPEGRPLFLDLQDVTFIDSSGVGAIVFLFKRIQAINGFLKILKVHGQPQELLSLLRVHEAIPVEWLDDSDKKVASSLREKGNE